jgi:hypothetical protein
MYAVDSAGASADFENTRDRAATESLAIAGHTANPLVSMHAEDTIKA